MGEIHGPFSPVSWRIAIRWVSGWKDLTWVEAYLSRDVSFSFVESRQAKSQKKCKVPKVSTSRAINDIRMERDCREWIIRRICSNLPPLFLAIIPPKLHIILVGLHVVQPAHLATNKADSSGNALYLYSYHQILRKDLCVCQDAKYKCQLRVWSLYVLWRRVRRFQSNWFGNTRSENGS